MLEYNGEQACTEEAYINEVWQVTVCNLDFIGRFG